MSRRPLLALVSFAAILGTAVFVLYATRTVRPQCTVGIARITGGVMTPAEAREWARSAEAKRQTEESYRRAVADGRCDPPHARWRGWIG